MHKDWKAVDNIPELAEKITANAFPFDGLAFRQDVEDVLQRAIEISRVGKVVLTVEEFNDMVYALGLGVGGSKYTSDNEIIFDAYRAAAKVRKGIKNV